LGDETVLDEFTVPAVRPVRIDHGDLRPFEGCLALSTLARLFDRGFEQPGVDQGDSPAPCSRGS